MSKTLEIFSIENIKTEISSENVFIRKMTSALGIDMFVHNIIEYQYFSARVSRDNTERN